MFTDDDGTARDIDHPGSGIVDHDVSTGNVIDQHHRSGYHDHHHHPDDHHVLDDHEYANVVVHDVEYDHDLDQYDDDDAPDCTRGSRRLLGRFGVWSDLQRDEQ